MIVSVNGFSHVFNSIEFDGIKSGIIKLLPKPHEFNRIPVTHPVLEDIITPIGVSVAGNIGKTYKVFIIILINNDPGALNFYFYILCHACTFNLAGL